jgi:hypothetical protein
MQRVLATSFAVAASLSLILDAAPALPRTPWGTLDLQGVTWNFATMTPLERPRDVSVPVFSEAEAATFERDTIKRSTETTTTARTGGMRAPATWTAAAHR